MKKLKTYVEQKNRWNAIFGGRALIIGQDNQKIADMIDSELSPENLSCDGEISRTEINRRYHQLTAAARELQKLDPSVKFYEFA